MPIDAGLKPSQHLLFRQALGWSSVHNFSIAQDTLAQEGHYLCWITYPVENGTLLETTAHHIVEAFCKVLERAAGSPKDAPNDVDYNHQSSQDNPDDG